MIKKASPLDAASGAKQVAETRLMQLSLRSILLAMALAVVAIQGSYLWHHEVLWSSEPYGDPSEEWFVSGREHLYTIFTPFIAAFTAIALFALWFAVSDRKNAESIIGCGCLAFPLLVFFGPFALFTCVMSFVTPIMGIWLLVRRRFVLGFLVILIAISWLVFACHYMGTWFAVYGD